MPELPEVETTLRGLSPHLLHRTVESVVIRQAKLHWPIPTHLPELLQGKSILGIRRRAKYLLMSFSHGTLIIHLGMSGSLQMIASHTPPGKHDHFDLILCPKTKEGAELTIRLHDPRRFGAVLWHPGLTPEDALLHPLLNALGPEPLDETFNGLFLHTITRSRGTPIKPFLMDAHRVAGIGNIYANEALFRAGIHPSLAAGKVSLKRCEILVEEIKKTLLESIEKGGSSLRDFVGAEGRAGHFQNHCFVYGREGDPCLHCQTPILQVKLGGRSSFFCPHCQR